jgi:hypothetical protein
MSLLYGLQQCLGWALMLVSMTFSIELFASVIVGIVAGKIIFPVEQQSQQSEHRRRMTRRQLPHDNDEEGSTNRHGRPTYGTNGVSISIEGGSHNQQPIQTHRLDGPNITETPTSVEDERHSLVRRRRR